MRNDPKTSKKTTGDQSQTLIIPKISPEMLEAARRAAETGTPLQEPPAAPEPAAPRPQAAPAAPRPEKHTPRAASRQKSLMNEQAELKQKIHDDHLWLNNPVMMRGLGLAPIVVAATGGENALMLCVAAVLLLTPTRVISVALCHLTGNRGRSLIYCFTAALLYIPAYLILYSLFGTALGVLGIYLPLMAVEPAIVKRMETPALETLGGALRRGINNTLGLCIAILFVGGLRELLAGGTLFGKQIFSMALLPIASQPAGGFILVGVAAALWTGIADAYINYKQEELKRRYADRKR